MLAHVLTVESIVLHDARGPAAAAAAAAGGVTFHGCYRPDAPSGGHVGAPQLLAAATDNS